MNIIKTQFNPNLRISSLVTKYEDRDETNFYEQLTHEEKFEYLELKIEELTQRQSAMIAECDSVKFMTDRNHPDEQLYKTHHTGFYNSETPTYELASDLDDQIDYYKSRFEFLNKESECA